MQHALALVPVLVLAVILVLLAPVLVRLLKPSSPGELTFDWFEGLNLDVYKPMQGLLADDDFHFLSRQPGYDALLHKRLRQDRLRIFREYLYRLIADYNRLYLLASFVISQTAEDQSILFTKLLRMRLNFWLATFMVEFNYRLCCVGISRVSLGAILQQMEDISQIASLPAARDLLLS